MSEQGFYVALLGSTAVVVLLISDWQRQRAALSAREHDSQVAAPRRISVGMALLLIAGFIGYGIVHGHPEWTNGDFGPLSPLVHHFFPVRVAE